jgi:hypothetical protein
MTRFVRMIKPQPIEQFISDVLESRAPLTEAYRIAWSATVRANALMDRVLRAQFAETENANVFGVTSYYNVPDGLTLQNARALQLEAQVEDRRADIFAMPVINCGDKWLRRLGRALVGSKRLRQGFGPVYARYVDETGAVVDLPLTSLLWATMNCERHAWEWDDNPHLTVPYDPAAIVDKKAKKALPSIDALQKALGFGRYDRIHHAPCWTVLKVVDGKFGTHGPDYGRFESAVLAAAREIMAEGAPEELSAFDEQFPQPAIV